MFAYKFAGHFSQVLAGFTRATASLGPQQNRHEPFAGLFARHQALFHALFSTQTLTPRLLQA